MAEESSINRKTATGLDENIAGLLCYAFGWVSGILFVLIEPDNPRIKFHALQSILTFGCITIIAVFLSFCSWVMPYFLMAVMNIIAVLIYIGSIILWLYLMVSTYKGKTINIPVFSNIALKILAN